MNNCISLKGWCEYPIIQMKTLQSEGISDQWISRFSSTMVKSSTHPWIASVSGHFWTDNFKNFFQSWWSHSLLPLKIFQSGFFLDWISRFSSTMVKSSTHILEIPSVLGHFWTDNFKFFFNHGEVIHSCPWKSFNLGAFLDCKFQNFLQPWWSHSLLYFQNCNFKILQSGGIFELCKFQNFLQPWWSHSLLSLKILQSGGLF